jgi:hypothetical protein
VFSSVQVLTAPTLGAQQQCGVGDSGQKWPHEQMRVPHSLSNTDHNKPLKPETSKREWTYM